MRCDICKKGTPFLKIAVVVKRGYETTVYACEDCRRKLQAEGVR